MVPRCRVELLSFAQAAQLIYPPAMKPADYLTYYATKFNMVEIDVTFYRTPSQKTVPGWADKTPDGFPAAKVPQRPPTKNAWWTVNTSSLNSSIRWCCLATSWAVASSIPVVRQGRFVGWGEQATINTST
jgi:Protein of unknown function DUF72